MRHLNLTTSFHHFISLLVIICIFYSFSLPWPKTIGVVECLIAILIVFLFFKSYARIFLSPNITIAFPFFFVVMIVNGFWANSITDIIRDLVAFLYLGIPISFYIFLRNHKSNLIDRTEKYDTVFIKFLLSFSLVGIVYSVRAVWPFISEFGLDFTSIYYSRLYPHVDYIFLDPSLLFSACFLASYSIGRLKAHYFFRSLILLLLSLVALSAPFFAVIRAPVLLYLVVIFSAFVFRFRYGLLLILPLFLFFLVNLYGLAELILLKQSESGANGKIEEFLYIYSYMVDGPIYNFILGSGFGGVYYSNILNESVRFTHNIFSYALLKGGVLALLATLTFFVWIMIGLIRKLVVSYVTKDIIAFASLVSFMASFLVSSLLEPGYKTLGYALLLLVYVYFVHFRPIGTRILAVH